jgi:N,N-dimethylformamidase
LYSEADLLYEYSLPSENHARLTVAAWQQSLAETGRVVTVAHFNGKLDRPRIVGRALAPEELAVLVSDPAAVKGVVAAWDFAHRLGPECSHERVAEVTGSGAELRLMNTPARGVTGYNWDGSETCFRHAPEQYGAIHFHDDDLTDCQWVPSCRFTVPQTLASGVYAAKLTTRGAGEASEYYVRFVVRSSRAKRTASIAVVLHTLTYLAYANNVMADVPALYDQGAGGVPEYTLADIARFRRPEYGLSVYDLHRDGSKVWYSSWLRPVLTNTGAHDLFIIDWFDQMGYDVDVLTDHDLHREGIDALAGYRLVVTGYHPEYVSETMVDTLHTFVEERGGRLMYLGGDGFVWVTAVHREHPIMEIRRSVQQTPIHAGEDFLSFSGEPGGLWRDRGRAPQKLLGVANIAQGGQEATYFLRKSDSFEEESSWIFAGVDDQRVGDFGVAQGGAAGGEIDAIDPRLGTPGWAYVLATSHGHPRLMLEVKENEAGTVPAMSGDVCPQVRADMIYFKTASGGAVFSASSMTWTGSLSHNNYDNSISRVTKNLVDRFAADDPLP